MTRWLPWVVAAVLAGCATQNAAEKKGKGAELEKLALTNSSPFDLAACGPREVPLESVNDEVLTGVLITARPMFEECLVDPTHRGPAAETKVVVKLTVTADKVEPEVTGENLTDAGKQCITDAVGKLKIDPAVKPTAATTGTVTLTHGAGSPKVVFGLNTADDVLGTLRLAQPSMCSCYQALGAKAPPHIVAQVSLFPDKPREVTLKGADDELGKCLLEKLNALQLPAVTGETRLPWDLRLIHSFAEAETADAPPELKFLQLDAIRSQRAADVAISIGKRSHASQAYDQVVTNYKKKPSPLLIKSLRLSCAKVLAADDAWLAAFRAMQSVEQRTHDLVAGLVATDPQWAEAEKATAQRLEGTTAQLGTIQARRKADEDACPKVKY